jgi:hypothetical protein
MKKLRHASGKKAAWFANKLFKARPYSVFAPFFKEKNCVCFVKDVPRQF